MRTITDIDTDLRKACADRDTCAKALDFDKLRKVEARIDALLGERQTAATHDGR